MQRARTLRIVTTALVATLAIVVASPTLAAAGPAVATAEADLVAQLALDLARTTGQPLSAPDESCAAEDLVVSWVEPDATSFEVGGHITPVGPAPGAATREVSGVVLCGTSTFAYLGFEAWKTDGTWQIAAVPAVDADHGAHVTDAAVADGGAGQLRSTGTYSAATAFSWSAYGSPEPHAAYDGQTTCDPAAKPGTIKLRDFLLDRYEGSGSFGISRECSIGGQSEHKEGRAFDWAVNALSSQRTLADDFVMRATMSDANGNLHSFARRMGIMYMIWDKKMWRAYRPGNGWAAYTGASPHTDHVHISLSRRAANDADLSFYRAYTSYGPAPVWPSASTVRSRMRDVSPFNVFVPEISYMIASGMSHGYSDGTYRPMNAVTRHAMAAFLWRQAGSPAGPFPASGFSDVNATTPNRTAIEWMAATGVSTGYDDGTFRPAERVSRGAMVAFMWRASGSPPATYSTLYRDVSSSHPFATAITWASRNNIVNGYSDGTFRSGSRTTRQAMAAFVHRWSTDG